MPIFREFLRHPFLTGAVAPSSPRLARAMTDGIGLESASVVVELGPGTGAITDVILGRVNPRARLVVVEANRALADGLAFRYRGQPVQVLHDSAANLPRLVPWPVDVVVSGLPWTVMPAQQQRRLLDAVAKALGPEGRFSTFAYAHAAWAPSARRFARELAERFSIVERGAVVWPNLPPAFVHRAAV
jgi:phosphatidylethanolamine/phosphatidyl-N-methylethanolamine N-methyltransferase